MSVDTSTDHLDKVLSNNLPAVSDYIDIFFEQHGLSGKEGGGMRVLSREFKDLAEDPEVLENLPMIHEVSYSIVTAVAMLRNIIIDHPEYREKASLELRALMHEILNTFAGVETRLEFLKMVDRRDGDKKAKMVDRRDGGKKAKMVGKAHKTFVNSVRRLIITVQGLEHLVNPDKSRSIPLEIVVRSLETDDVQINLDYKGNGEPELGPVERVVFSELVTNAIKYSGKTEKVVTVIVDKDDNYTYIRVANPGANELDTDVIFENGPNSRVYAEKGVFGTGQGLSMIQTLAKKTGGRIFYSYNPIDRKHEFTQVIKSRE